MNIRRIEQLNEELNQLLNEDIVFNESPIVYGEYHGKVETIDKGIETLTRYESGFVNVDKCLTVIQEVNQKEIDNGLYDKVLKGVAVEKLFPITLVWGEKDKYFRNKKLEGHGIIHMIQGHPEQLIMIKRFLSSCINKKKPAKYDRNGNYTIRDGKYRFSFALKYNEDYSPKEAILITAFRS